MSKICEVVSVGNGSCAEGLTCI